MPVDLAHELLLLLLCDPSLEPAAKARKKTVKFRSAAPPLRKGRGTNALLVESLVEEVGVVHTLEHPHEAPAVRRRHDPGQRALVDLRVLDVCEVGVGADFLVGSVNLGVCHRGYSWVTRELRDRVLVKDRVPS
jgi:hypothetical protein